MDAKRWLNEVRTELVRRKLPSFYVERLLWELSDHFSDCMEDRMSTDAKDLHGVFQRLGSPGHVATRAANEFRQSRFSRRHPVLMFVLLPILSLPLLWIVSLASIIMGCRLLGFESGNDTHAAAWQAADTALPYVLVAIMVAPLALTAAFFCRLANRAAVNWKWMLAACCLIAVLGSAAMTQFVLPTETTSGSLSFGLRFATKPTASQVLQFLLPLAICGWALRGQFRGRPLQSA